jgi:CRISPR-associated protein Cas2
MERNELERKLFSEINVREDQVLFVELGPATGRGERVIHALGRPYTKIDASCYVV